MEQRRRPLTRVYSPRPPRVQPSQLVRSRIAIWVTARTALWAVGGRCGRRGIASLHPSQLLASAFTRQALLGRCSTVAEEGCPVRHYLICFDSYRRMFIPDLGQRQQPTSRKSDPSKLTTSSAGLYSATTRESSPTSNEQSSRATGNTECPLTDAPQPPGKCSSAATYYHPGPTRCQMASTHTATYTAHTQRRYSTQEPERRMQAMPR